MKNKKTNTIEKGGHFYWYFWHLGNYGAENILDSIFLFISKCLVPIYHLGFILKHSKRKNAGKKFTVISVGNLTMGGTGKTPCVEFLIRKLTDKKLKVGLLTRGYARRNRDNKKISSSATRQNISVKDIGDEPYLFSKHFPSVPIFISCDRAKSLSEAAQKRECDIFIMDDGFQSPNIEKDLEILLINKRNPFGNGHLLPAGFLREPVNSIKKADLIILTHCDESTENEHYFLSKRFSQIPTLESIHEPLYFEDFVKAKKYKAEEIKNKRFLSLCSLADPVSFEESLKKLNLEPIKKVRFPDHYIYKPEDIQWLNALIKKEKIDFIAITEKDWVRLPEKVRISAPVLCLIMDFKITKSEKTLDDMIDKVLKKRKK